MKKNLTPLLLAVIALNLSCKKPLVSDNTHCSPMILLTKVSGTSRLDGDGSLKTVNMIFTYNNNNLLVKIKDDKKSIEVSYADGYHIVGIQYSDSTGTVAKRRVLQPQVTFGFNKPKQELESVFEGDQLLSKSIINYTYTDELLTKVERSQNNIKIAEDAFTYKNENIATRTDGTGKIYSYKYGNHRNPFSDVSLKFHPGLIDFTSLNEPIEVEEKQNGTTKILTSVYTYNKDGYPLTLKTLDNNGNLVVDYQFQYGTFLVGCF